MFKLNILWNVDFGKSGKEQFYKNCCIFFENRNAKRGFFYKIMCGFQKKKGKQMFMKIIEIFSKKEGKNSFNWDWHIVEIVKFREKLPVKWQAIIFNFLLFNNCLIIG